MDSLFYKILLLYLVCFIHFSFEQFVAPSITTFYNQVNKQFTCVVEENIRDEGTAVIGPIGNSKSIITSYVNASNGVFTSKVNYVDFESKNLGDEWTKIGDSQNSFQHNFSPILDARWENLHIYKTYGEASPVYPIYVELPPNKFTINISVRSKRNAQIFLCDSYSYTYQIKYNKCYWILIDAFENNVQTAIRKCAVTGKTIPDDYPRDNYKECGMKRQFKEIPGKLLHENEWRHLTLIFKNNKQIILRELRHSEPILNFTDTENDLVSPKYLCFRGYKNAVAEWKIHDYKFLSLKKSNELINLGPSLKFSETPMVCMSMYIALCPDCSLTIHFENPHSHKKASKFIKGSSGPFIKWQYVSLELEWNAEGPHYQMYVKLTQNKNKNFWFIDNIQQCSKNEIKIAKVFSVEPHELFKCVSLKKTEFSIGIENINSSSLADASLQCEDPKYAGKNCNINCQVATGTENCQSSKFCFFENFNVICSCAAGYKGHYCKEECRVGYYGNNCNKVCGNCVYTYNCNKKTGICSSDCDRGYTGQRCEERLYPQLINPPKIVEIGYTSITLELTDISYEGVKKPFTYEIQYQTDYNAKDWMKTSKISLGTNRITKLDDLSKETTYYFRVVLNTLELEHFIYTDIIIINATTMCDEKIEASVKQGSRDVTITFNVTDNRFCSLQNYYLTIQVNDKDIGIWTGLTSSMIISNLIPNTDYIIKIIYKNVDGYTQTISFKTEEDGPDKIRNLKTVNITDNKIVLSWEPPNNANGVIRHFVVLYQHISYINCASSFEKETTIQIAPNEISHVVLKNLKPYSSYLLTVYGVTIKDGQHAVILVNTTANNVISPEELPSTLTIEPKSYDVIIRWESLRCFKLKGPITYHFNVTCVNTKWCNLFTPNKQYITNGLEEEININKLIPFTNYLVEMKASRMDENLLTTFSVKQNFSTKVGDPPQVRNLTIYSVENKKFLIRWLPPYPPHGEIAKYEIVYCFTLRKPACTKNENLITIDINDIQYCNLWEENYICADVKILYENYNHKIIVRAVNKNFETTGQESFVTQNTYTGISTAPLNVSKEWDTERNKLILYWYHPNKSNGPIDFFTVKLEFIDTEISSIDLLTNFDYKVTVDKYQKQYHLEIDKSITYSSTYNVIIRANSDGNTIETTVTTPPETPQLISDEIILEKYSNISITINVPGVKNNTKSKNSFVYVVVTRLGSVRKRRNTDEKSVEIIQIKKDIFNEASTEESEISWIAIELESFVHPTNIEIGTGKNMYSEKLKEPIFNNYLEPGSEYKIAILLMNEYKSERRFKTYFLNSVQTENNPLTYSGALYALFLLLLIPIILFLTYRYVLKKNKFSSRLRMRPTMNPRQENPEPDVIPLTEETTVKKHKKPAVSPKPNSIKPKESRLLEKRESQLNPIATNFFHSRLIPLNNFESYLKEALENKELEEQHALFPRGQTKPWNYGMLKPNKFKNRYNNLIAYDFNRVVLEKINNDQHSDYINASYIHGYKQEKAYIATQGPKTITINDFWRMIWQEKVQYIIMLTSIFENGKKKCEKYWPDIEQSQEFGNIQIYFEKSEVYADYEYRTFIVTYKNESRNVTQMHFTSWPDHGVPMYPQLLVPFLKRMLTISQSTAPIVVHCSAGIGRTGTIILCDICLRMAAREGAVDVLRFLHEIREQRANLVDNIDQYKLVHMILLECLLAPDTNILCDENLSNNIQKLIDEGGLQIQLNYLQNTTWQDKALDFTFTEEIKSENAFKNRFQDIIPQDHRIFLPRYPITDENSDYINAVPVDGFRFKEQFIVTQLPLPNTINDFWRMVSEQSSKVIVSLNTLPTDDPTFCEFWPKDAEEMNPTQHITLKFIKMQTFEYYDLYYISLEDRNVDKKESKFTVQIVQFKDWESQKNIPESIENLVMFWEDAELLTRGKNPMIVTCYDGATASGLFVALSFIIEKIKLEQQCDVCLAVRVIRRSRKQFITNKAQFECLYKSAVIFLSMFETYSNFQLNKDKPLVPIKD